MASQLKAGLDTLAAEVQGNSPANAFTRELIAKANPALENLFDAKLQPQAAQELYGWLGRNPPKSQGVYNPPWPE
jgi:hypothetical protein